MGSLPGANLLLLSEAENGYSVPQFRLTLSPIGHLASVSWNLTRNNQSIMNGSTSSSQNIAHNFSDGDSIGLQLNISGALGQSQLEAYTWTVDGQNNASIPIYVNGSSTNVTGLVIGANSRLGHGQAEDGSGGVGGDFVGARTMERHGGKAPAGCTFLNPPPPTRARLSSVTVPWICLVTEVQAFGATEVSTFSAHKSPIILPHQPSSAHQRQYRLLQPIPRGCDHCCSLHLAELHRHAACEPQPRRCKPRSPHVATLRNAG